VSTAVRDKSLVYRDVFQSGVSTEKAWSRYGSLRARALAAMTSENLATRGSEDWVHGDPGALAAGAVVPLSGVGLSVAPVRAPSGAIRLVFANGLFDSGQSDLSGLPAGVAIGPLSAAEELSEVGAVADDERSGFTALNTMFWRDGFCLRLAEGVVLDQPLEVLTVNDPLADGGIVPTRNLIVMGAASRATVIERSGDGSPGVVAQPLTEVLCGEGSTLNHVKLVLGAETGEHHGTVWVRQAAASTYHSWEIVTGGERTRRELRVDLAGDGAVCDLNALYMGAGNQRLDMRTRVDHNAPGCETRELYKGLLGGAARGIFDGMIRVARDSQRTNAQQTNRNLVLSDEAVVNSIPRLEIYADDVKCSHGSTTGQLADEEVFYLQTRGFSRQEARTWLAWAFASEVVDSLPTAALQSELSTAMTASFARVGGGL